MPAKKKSRVAPLENFRRLIFLVFAILILLYVVWLFITSLYCCQVPAGVSIPRPY